MDDRQVKTCPFCKETIKAEAIKCRFCGEFIEDDPQEKIAQSKTATATKGEEAKETTDTESGTPSNVIAELSLSPVIMVPQVLKLLGWFLASGLIGYGTYYATAKEMKVMEMPNAKLICWGLCAAVAAIGLAIFWFKYMKFKKHEFTITNDRIECRHGLFSRTISNIEMWRIQDIRLNQPFIQRIFGVGTIIVESTDPSDPHLEIGPIAKASTLYQTLRDTAVEADRRRGVLHLDQ